MFLRGVPRDKDIAGNGNAHRLERVARLLELARGALELAREERLSSVHVLLPTEAEAVALEPLGFAVRQGVQYHFLNEGYRTPDDVLYVVYGRCHARLTDVMTLGGWVALHAGVVSVGGRRALLVGEQEDGVVRFDIRMQGDRQTVFFAT